MNISPTKKLPVLSSMVVVFFGSLAFSAIFTPLIYGLIQNFSAQTSSKFLTYLSGKSLDAYFDRIRWIALLLSLPWLIKKLAIGSVSEIGLVLKKSFFKKWLKYFSYGIIFILLLVLFQSPHITVIARNSIGLIWVKMALNVLCASVLIAFLEEILFRGLLLTAFYARVGRSKAIFLSALVFSFLHFATPVDFRSQTQVMWYDGWKLAWASCLGMVQHIEWPYFFNLLTLGTLLNLLALRHKHLGGCMGFHAGIVFCLLFLRRNFETKATSSSLWYGNGRLTDSLISFLILLIVTVLFSRTREKAV